jgi:hypothetical protein
MEPSSSFSDILLRLLSSPVQTQLMLIVPHWGPRAPDPQSGVPSSRVRAHSLPRGPEQVAVQLPILHISSCTPSHTINLSNFPFTTQIPVLLSTAHRVLKTLVLCSCKDMYTCARYPEVHICTCSFHEKRYSCPLQRQVPVLRSTAHTNALNLSTSYTSTCTPSFSRTTVL